MSTPGNPPLRIRLSDEDRAALERAAGDRPLASWAREVLLAAAGGARPPAEVRQVDRRPARRAPVERPPVSPPADGRAYRCPWPDCRFRASSPAAICVFHGRKVVAV